MNLFRSYAKITICNSNPFSPIRTFFAREIQRIMNLSMFSNKASAKNIIYKNRINWQKSRKKTLLTLKTVTVINWLLGDAIHNFSLLNMLDCGLGCHKFTKYAPKNAQFATNSHLHFYQKSNLFSNYISKISQ